MRTDPLTQTGCKNTYPIICKLLGPAFLNAVSEIVGHAKGRFFQLIKLLNENPADGSELESNLALLLEAVSIDKARQAYASKLSTVTTGAGMEDFCFEIQVAAQASQILDKGSMILEHPIPRDENDPPGENNSDVFGKFNGDGVRIDATVYRGQQSEPFNVDNEDVLKFADISSGFDLTIEKPLRTTDAAESAKRLLESLHQHHLSTGGTYFEKDGFTFLWEPPYYRSTRAPFTNVIFHPEGDELGRHQTRDIHHVVSVQSLAPQYIQEEIYAQESREEGGESEHPPRAKNVFTPDKIRDPASKTIRDRLQVKLRQCEAGTISLIAIKTPNPQHKSDLKDALFGAVYGVEVTPILDSEGNYVADEKKILRANRAPFFPEEDQTPEERREFSSPFKVMSGVWLFPACREDAAEPLINPNATNPIPGRLTEILRAGGNPMEGQGA